MPGVAKWTANPTRRLIVVLSRYAGLRCPSEVLSLKWEDVNLPAGRMAVFSPKQEHIPGKAWRQVPIAPRLRPHLEEAFDAAADRGAVYVVPGDYRLAALKPQGWVNCNLRTTVLKLIRRAGLEPWPKPFHNMRASLQTEWSAKTPAHAVCKWLGNSKPVAERHYLQVRDSDFDPIAGRAAIPGAVALQNPARTAADGNGENRPASTQGVDIGRLSPTPSGGG